MPSSNSLGSFEKALPLYEKCIKLIEKKYGGESKNMISPLKSYVQLLAATNQNEKAQEIEARLQKITNEAKKSSKTLMKLSFRCSRSFSTYDSPMMEKQAGRNANMRSPGSRGATVNLGSSPVDYSQITSTADYGKSFRDHYNGLYTIAIKVKVEVDEKGKVTSAEALTEDESFKKAAENYVKQWSLKPFVYDGKPDKMNGYIECLFFNK